jgi:hypothetical protein
MRVHNYPKTIIFSVFQKDMPKSYNETAHRWAKGQLKNSKIPFSEVLGCYKGRQEKSLVIPESKGKIASVISRLYHQESVLVLDNERGAWVSDCKTSERLFLGWFVPCTERTAKQQSGWTLSDGQYYIISDCRLGGHLQK